VIVKSELLVLVHLLWSVSRAGLELPNCKLQDPKPNHHCKWKTNLANVERPTKYVPRCVAFQLDNVEHWYKRLQYEH
jgi:hypothetical protein